MKKPVKRPKRKVVRKRKVVTQQGGKIKWGKVGKAIDKGLKKTHLISTVGQALTPLASKGIAQGVTALTGSKAAGQVVGSLSKAGLKAGTKAIRKKGYGARGVQVDKYGAYTPGSAINAGMSSSGQVKF